MTFLSAQIKKFEFPFINPWFKKSNAGKKASSFIIQNINLNLRAGDRVGIIGLNGAGKSTLLRILSGIYPLHEGSLESDGIIQPMLDNGVGFEPDGTGYDNIFYRGYLLGRSHKEILSRIEDIIEFSELSAHIYKPVKFYSSGMAMRLHFSIATAWSSDILIMDEIMGVGDALFHTKAELRIKSHLNKSKILILSSHNLALLKEYCNNILIMDSGSAIFYGSFEEGSIFYENYIKRLSS
jgi:ABC-type polysaccharide/polyol phosphate transport system ATPase subunit